MNKKFIIVFITFAIILTGCNVRIPLISNSLATRIDQYFQKEAKSSFSGVVLVAQKGKIIISKGYGIANQEWNISNTVHTKFAIGSITKSFTAMAIMILQERGKLNVQDPICKYITDCPTTWQSITIHHLLIHSSGIKEYNNLYHQPQVNIDPCQAYKPEEFIAFFKDLPLDFEPGSRFQYSNSGYYLLGIVIEKVSGESYEDFIQNNILQPLGMTESGYDQEKIIIKYHASGYSWNGQDIDYDCLDVSQKYSAYGLYSTVGDLYKWDQALYTNKLVSINTLNLIFTSYIPIPIEFDRGLLGNDSGYGYGWGILQRYGHRVNEHAGEVVGFTSVITRYPDDQVTIIILSNKDPSTKDFIDPEYLSIEIESYLFGNK